MHRAWLLTTAGMGFLGVAFGALGGHAVKRLVEGLADGPQRLAWWETSSKYHLTHALALGLVAALAPHVPGRKVQVAGALWLLGTVLFSGSLYAMALTGERALARLTPVGGVCFMAGWLVLGWAALALPKAPGR